GPGGPLVNSAGAAQDRGPFLLESSGIYTLTLQNPTPRSQAYSFRLIDLQGAAVIPLTLGATVTSPGMAANAVDVYRLSGAGGQKLYFDGLRDDGLVYTQLFSAVGLHLIASNYVEQDGGPFTLA